MWNYKIEYIALMRSIKIRGELRSLKDKRFKKTSLIFVQYLNLKTSNYIFFKFSKVLTYEYNIGNQNPFLRFGGLTFKLLVNLKRDIHYFCIKIGAKLVFPKNMLYLEIIMKFICMWYIWN